MTTPDLFALLISVLTIGVLSFYAGCLYGDAHGENAERIKRRLRRQFGPRPKDKK